jgi:hypothetical protein
MDLTTQKDEYFDGVRALLRDLGIGAPLVADSTIEAYAVPKSWAARPIMFLGAGWEELERQPGTDFRWRWMSAGAEIRLYNPYHQAVPASIALGAASFQEPRTIELRLDGALFGQMATHPNRPATRQYRFLLPPGDHTLRLAAPTSSDPGRVGRQISVRVFRLAAEFGQPLNY